MNKKGKYARCWWYALRVRFLLTWNEVKQTMKRPTDISKTTYKNRDIAMLIKLGYVLKNR